MDTQATFSQLDRAEAAMRANLCRHDLHENARAHVERGLNHVRVAYIATNDIGKARTVKRPEEDCETFDHLLQMGQATPGIVTLKRKV